MVRCAPMTPVLFQDESFLVCVKSPGLLSGAERSPAPGSPSQSLPAALEQDLGRAVYPVHRLDRAAGGLMVWGKNRRAAAELSGAMQRGNFLKEYLCIVRGRPREDAGTYRDLLLHDQLRNKSFVVERMRRGVREASLSYRVLGEREGLSLLRIQLHTGRTHQIRVQLASRKTPLAGDRKYGGGAGEMALWSFRLAFPHPDTGEPLSFLALPDGAAWEPFRQELAALTADPAASSPQG